MIISTIFGAISVALVGTIAASAALVGGGFISYFLWDKALSAKSRKIIKEAEAEAEVIRKDKILQEKEKLLQLKSDHERDINERTNKLIAAENKLMQKKMALPQTMNENTRKRKEVDVKIKKKKKIF